MNKIDNWTVGQEPDAYRAYVKTLNGFEGDNIHIDDVRDALLDGFVWSVT